MATFSTTNPYKSPSLLLIIINLEFKAQSQTLAITIFLVEYLLILANLEKCLKIKMKKHGHQLKA